MITRKNEVWPEGYPKYTEDGCEVVSLTNKPQMPFKYTEFSYTPMFSLKLFKSTKDVFNFDRLDSCLDYNKTIINNSIPQRATLITRGSQYIVKDVKPEVGKPVEYVFPHLVEAEIFKARLNSDHHIPTTSFLKGWNDVTDTVHYNIRRDCELIGAISVTSTDSSNKHGTYLTASIPYHIVNPMRREKADAELTTPYVDFIVNVFNDAEKATVKYVGMSIIDTQQKTRLYQFEFTKVTL